MSETPVQIEQLAAAVSLPLREEDVPAVRAAFENLLAMARLVEEAGLDPHIEPAPVFQP